jgi:hypothetical protein
MARGHIGILALSTSLPHSRPATSVKDGRDDDGIGKHAVEDQACGEGKYAATPDVAVDLRETPRGLGDRLEEWRISNRKRTATRGSTECSRYQSAAASMSRAAAARILYFKRNVGDGCALRGDGP